MSKRIEGEQTQSEPELYTLLAAVKLAYRQTKSDLKYIKYNSNFWKGKTYMWGRTHLSVAWHNFYWHVIKR